MEKTKQRKRWGLRIFLVFLLAVLCVGGAELAASYYFAPDLYYKVTTPIKAGAKAVAGFCRQRVEDAVYLSNAIADQLELEAAIREAERERRRQEALEAQRASEALLKANMLAADPSITEFALLPDGRRFLTGGTVPLVYFRQDDPAWADLKYGSDNIGSFGCGPAVMAMVVSSLTDYERSPVQMAQWAVESRHWAPRSGSAYSIVEGAARDFGLSCVSMTDRSAEAIRTTLLNGDLIVALMGPGHFTQGGHFIVLHGATLSGSVLVADPNSEERSLMEWDPAIIAGELSGSRGSGAPLWAISN